MTDRTSPAQGTHPLAPQPTDACHALTLGDSQRRACPVQFHGESGWSLLGHPEVEAAASNWEALSNKVSAHLAIPNSLDPPQHDVYRRMLNAYFEPTRVQGYQARFQELILKLWRHRPEASEIEFMEQVAHPYALGTQAAFAGWPEADLPRLDAWHRAQQRAVQCGDREALGRLGQEFLRLVQEQIEARRPSHPASEVDAIGRLMQERPEGRPLQDHELASILRNWTVGELATMASALGIVVHYLAGQPALQHLLRRSPQKLDYAIDEILRLHGPLASNRRTVRQEVTLSGQTLLPGQKATLHWSTANRDDRVFVDPLEFRWDRDLSQSLLYGRGIHACPGADLARLELRLALHCLLQESSLLALGSRKPQPARPPATGWSTLWLTVT